MDDGRTTKFELCPSSFVNQVHPVGSKVTYTKCAVVFARRLRYVYTVTMWF